MTNCARIVLEVLALIVDHRQISVLLSIYRNRIVKSNLRYQLTVTNKRINMTTTNNSSHLTLDIILINRKGRFE
jgi:hypothetical protein